jgi:hypothetical protein
LKAVMDYQYAQIDYDDNASRKGDFNQFRIGIEGEVMPNMIVKARTGIQFRDYTFPAENDFASWVGIASVDYQIRPDLKLIASAGREPFEATFGDVNFYLQHIVRLGYEYQIRPRWKQFSQFKLYRHRYSERATIGNQTQYRRDNHVSLETGLRYLLRDWIEIETAYEFYHRDSNFAGLDYNDHRASISTSFAY